MKALLLKEIVDMSQNQEPLTFEDVPSPIIKKNEVMIQVATCGICHTELDEIEGRTPPAFFPMILGHQAVGSVIKIGSQVTLHQIGDRVGVGWIHSACGQCEHCLNQNDNLCSKFKATGRDVYGGYAEMMCIPEQYAHRIPDLIDDDHAAPLLCAGAIGYRSLMLTRVSNGQTIGLTGFGASGHLVLKIVQYLYPDSDVYVFARSPKEQEFAMTLGAVWSGNTDEQSPELLHTIVDTTPVWKPIIHALENLRPGGRLVINAIRKEDHDKGLLSNVDYVNHLWMEKEIKTVANVSKLDIQNFLILAAEAKILPEIQVYQFNMDFHSDKNSSLRRGRIVKFYFEIMP
jgi:alcohol dehydrogenase, propanol-preferring